MLIGTNLTKRHYILENMTKLFCSYWSIALRSIKREQTWCICIFIHNRVSEIISMTKIANWRRALQPLHVSHTEDVSTNNWRSRDSWKEGGGEGRGGFSLNIPKWIWATSIRDKANQELTNREIIQILTLFS